MGVVHEAVHLDLMRTVALKVLDPERMGVDAERRFKVEARAIAQLSHENLVKLFEFGVAQDGRPFYAMELLTGESLDKKLERERGMDFREAVRIGVQACYALETAHAASVIHRDIKPANLFLSDDGKLKLLDFGVAKAAFNVETAGEELQIVGTPEYMAPEQARGQADERSDIYALGVVLFELLSGRLPHEADSPVLLLDAKFRKEPESLRTLVPERGIPKMLDVAVSRALSPEPEHRYRSAAEMRAALEAALNESETAKTPPRKLVVRGLASAIALAVVGVIGIGCEQAGSAPESRGRTVANCRQGRGAAGARCRAHARRAPRERARSSCGAQTGRAGDRDRLRCAGTRACRREPGADGSRCSRARGTKPRASRRRR